MPVQVTPYKGSRLTDIALQAENIKDRREGLRLQDVALKQRGEHQAFQREATTAQVGQAQQRIAMAAKKLGVDEQQAERQMITETIKAVIQQNPQGSPQELKAQSQAMYAQLLGDPEAAAQRFADAPDDIFTVSKSNADIRADEQNRIGNERNAILDSQRGAESEAKAAKAQLDLQKGQFELENKQRDAEREEGRQDMAAVQRERAGEDVRDILSPANAETFDAVYGKFNAQIPEAFRKQAVIDMRATVEGLEDWIAIEERAKLKGQGTITDGETDMLKRAVSRLTNFSMSEGMARKEFRTVSRIMGLDIGVSGMPDSNGNALNPTVDARGGNDQGQIMEDANGNRARVFADGRIEEI